LEELLAELRDVKDEKSDIQRRLVVSEARSREYEDKYTRIREDSSKQPSKRDYEVLMERNMKNLAMINDYEQKKQSLETYRDRLANRDIQVEQMKTEQDELRKEVLILKQANSELKNKLRALEEMKTNGFELSNNKK
jgi:aspartokinase